MATKIFADQFDDSSFQDKVEVTVNTGAASDDLVHKNGDTMTGELTVPSLQVDNSLQVGDSQVVLKADTSNNRVAVNLDNPQSALHVAGDIRMTSGGLQFTDTATEEPKLVLYKGGTDFAIIRRYADDYTILQIWAPSETWFTSNEATLSLVRGNEPNQEYIDLYTIDYGSPQHGIRIQKRGTGQYRPFVFEFSDGNNISEAVRIESDQSVNFSGNIQVNGTINDVTINTNTILIELRTDDPSSPFKGQVWFRTDL